MNEKAIRNNDDMFVFDQDRGLLDHFWLVVEQYLAKAPGMNRSSDPEYLALQMPVMLEICRERYWPLRTLDRLVELLDSPKNPYPVVAKDVSYYIGEDFSVSCWVFDTSNTKAEG